MKRTLDFPTQISKWCNWVSKDSDGNWHEWEYKPRTSIICWCMQKVGEVELLFNDPDKSNWKGSLFEVMK